MDRGEFIALLAPLVKMFDRTFDVADWTVYYQALADVPSGLLQAAVVQAARESRAFMPRAGELRALAEAARRARIAARPWSACEACSDLKGFIETIDDAGVTRLARCPCIARHDAQLAAEGLPTRALTESAEHAPESEAALWESIPTKQIDPRQLPPAVASEIKAIARQHRMPLPTTPQTDLEGRPLPEWRRR